MPEEGNAGGGVFTGEERLFIAGLIDNEYLGDEHNEPNKIIYNRTFDTNG